VKYMGYYYQTLTSKELEVLRSKKYNRRSKLQRDVATYLNLQEIRKLNYQIQTIDNELEARRLQQGFDW